jgi:hypothetical protein
VGAAEALGGSVHDRLIDPVWIVIERIVPDAHYRPAFLLKEAVDDSACWRPSSSRISLALRHAKSAK